MDRYNDITRCDANYVASSCKASLVIRAIMLRYGTNSRSTSDIINVVA
jgi:hypothetical protein